MPPNVHHETLLQPTTAVGLKVTSRVKFVIG